MGAEGIIEAMNNVPKRMSLEERLQAEAQARAAQLASRYPPGRCIWCGTAGDGHLIPAEFRWRKQVGRGVEDHVRVEHLSTHTLCPSCLDDVRGRRRWFWMLRYAGGIGLAASLCGVLAVPVILWAMRLTMVERRQAMLVGVVACVLLPIALLALWFARRLSVPATLRDMTGRGWECLAVRVTQSSVRRA